MQTILGAGGAIGVRLAKALKLHTNEIRLVSRNPSAVNPGDELLCADLTNPTDVRKAVAGSEVVYLTVGLPYDIKVWRAAWPGLMQNVLDACRIEGAKLVFFDNVYMYDPDYMDRMTEDTPIKPVSKKGEIRVQLCRMIWDAVERDELQALIARSADFYGPAIKNTSILTVTVLDNLSKGKKAIWFGSEKYRHSFTYTPDAGKATALLGNTPDAYNQVWHLPTAPNPPTGKEWIEIIANEMGAEPKFRIMSRFMMRLAGVFVPALKEMVEMMYQCDRDYVFDSSKFEKRFDFKPTPYLQGIKSVIRQDYSTQPATADAEAN